MLSSSSRASTQTQNPRRLVIPLAVLAVAILVVGLVMYLQKVRLRDRILAEQAKATPALSPREDVGAALALQNYLQRIRAQVRDHEAAYAQLQQKKALAWNIQEREDIERDRKIVRDFMDTNDRLAESLKHGESLIRAELETAKVSPAARDMVIERYEKTQKPLLPLQMQVRACDNEIGKNAMAVLSMLETNWGEWTRDSKTGQIDFTNFDTLANFRVYVAKIADAAYSRKHAEDDLAEYQRAHPVQ